MRMTASWFRSRRAYRIRGCGAMLAPAGKLRLGHTGTLDVETMGVLLAVAASRHSGMSLR